MRRQRIHAKGDERILGESDFVLQVPKEQDERLEKRTRMRSQGKGNVVFNVLMSANGQAYARTGNRLLKKLKMQTISR